MITVSDVATIIKTLSSTSRMSLRRVIKISYLLDWHMSFKMGIPSNHNWVYGACGPTDMDFEKMIKADAERFELREADNHYGGRKLVVHCRDVEAEGQENQNLEVALNHVKERLFDIQWDELARIVASTYPMTKYHPGEVFDLQNAADEYNDLLKRRC